MPSVRHHALFAVMLEKVAAPVKAKVLVLVVEDETLIRMSSAEVIRDLGFEVLEAVDADHAVSLLESVQGITVVFTDIQMPGSMDGLLLAGVIKDRWPPIALLVTSGKARPAPLDMPTGARFISKPYSPFEPSSLSPLPTRWRASLGQSWPREDTIERRSLLQPPEEAWQWEREAAADQDNRIARVMMA
jgi:CheY-like chemotaxis protein